MTDFDRRKHWEYIYETRELKDVSWYEAVPATSLHFIEQSGIPKTAKIIDVGGGDSFLVDSLLDAGYTDVSVLDISEKALERAKQRLGARADQVTWIVSDASTFEPQEQYDFWHDRAVFHFLTEEHDIENYLHVLSKGIKPAGVLVIGTFAENGPAACSGIPVRQYSEQTLTDRLNDNFDKINCLAVDHRTPSGTIQQFIFCRFRRKERPT